MDIIGYFWKWKTVEEKKVPEKVMAQLQRKIDETMYSYIKKLNKNKKIPKTIPGCTVYSESEKFFYKAFENPWEFIEDQKRFKSTSKKIILYRKPKKK